MILLWFFIGFTYPEMCQALANPANPFQAGVLGGLLWQLAPSHSPLAFNSWDSTGVCHAPRFWPRECLVCVGMFVDVFWNSSLPTTITYCIDVY